MTIREAFEGIAFHRGTWKIKFKNEELFDLVDTTEKCAEDFDDLEELWNEFADENDFARDSIIMVEESYDPYFDNLEKHLDLDITMVPDGSYSILVREPESGLDAHFHYRPGTALTVTLEDLVEEIRSWIILMDEERSER